MYVRSPERLGFSTTLWIYDKSGLADGNLKTVGITPELLNLLVDLVFYTRHPNLRQSGIPVGSSNLKREWKAIQGQLSNPSSTVPQRRFSIDSSLPTDDPPVDFSKTEKELGAWELAKLDSTIRFAFSTEEIKLTGGRVGSYVTTLSVKFASPRFTVFIANHLLENARDQTKSRMDRATWLRIRQLIRSHAFEHLRIYRRTAQTMEKVFGAVLNRLLPIPTAKKPLAVSKAQLDDYIRSVGDFLSAIVVREFWEKNCDWEKQDYPELSQNIMKAGAVFMPMGLKVNCGLKPSIPDGPHPPAPVISQVIRASRQKR